jgi:hypothetical protein
MIALARLAPPASGNSTDARLRASSSMRTLFARAATPNNTTASGRSCAISFGNSPSTAA